MATVRDPSPKLHPQIKREIAEAFLMRWMEAAEAAGLQRLPPDGVARLAENDPDFVLRKEFGGTLGGESYWDRLEAHLAKEYAGKTTIIPADAQRAPRLPVPRGYPPWANLFQGDYPDPRFCSEIEGLLEFKIYWPLWKMGVPLDFKYPSVEADEIDPKAAVYERRRIKPLLRKARRLVVLLEKTSDELVEAEKANPRYRTPYAPEPHLEDSQVKTFAGLGSLARYAGQLMDGLPRSRRGPKKKYSKDDFVDRLEALGLSHAKAGEVLKLLGLEGAGNARERIRQRQRRQKKRRGGTK